MILAKRPITFTGDYIGIYGSYLNEEGEMNMSNVRHCGYGGGSSCASILVLFILLIIVSRSFI